MQRYIRWFSEIGLADLALVGGKNASLGEMYRALTAQGIRVPNGFAITSDGYRAFLGQGDLAERLSRELDGLDTRDIADLQRRGAAVRQALLETPLPDDLAAEIVTAYQELGGQRPDLAVAVRSSATAEDLPEASFAGQQESFLNVRGETALLESSRRCFASLFKDRAISYRVDRGFDILGVQLSIGVQHMVRADLACSGVIFTLDTETGFPDLVLVSASYGFGETIVQGTVTPDEFGVFKPTLRSGFRPIIRRRLGTKEAKLVCGTDVGEAVRLVPVPEDDRARFAVTDDEVLQLARWACTVEEHYRARRGQPTPLDLEWAKDGPDGDLYILQARPETVQSRRDRNVLERYRIRPGVPPIITGCSIGDRVAHGVVRVIPTARDLQAFKPGEVLVTDRTDPDWEPILKQAAAVVTNRGGRTCHAAIVSRELGVPAIVGTGHATTTLRTGDHVTVSCAEGETGRVYPGEIPFQVERTDIRAIPRTRTQIMLNVANPDEVLALSFLPNDGAGLVRLEFIIGNTIRAHPLALLDFDTLPASPERDQIERLTRGWTNPADFFVDRLAEGIGVIAAAFFPKDVIVRFSDFKTNEYAHLLGGRPYEPPEENPMLGFRGASRYYHPRYRRGFALECAALRRVRSGMGLTNVKPMIPFCRTVQEAQLVLAEMAANGLARGVDGLEVYVMCEVPSNVLLADAFADLFDGFSIGSNDLTQLLLGVDRDSEIVAPLFDERNPAVLRMIAEVIRVCRARGRKIGICGQAPSDYPEFVDFLVAQGIDSISLNPDTALKTRLAVAEREAAPRRPGDVGPPGDGLDSARGT